MDSLVLSRWMLNAALVPALPVALLQLLTSHPADRNSSIQLQDEENAERRKETRRAEQFYQRKKACAVVVDVLKKIDIRVLVGFDLESA